MSSAKVNKAAEKVNAFHANAEQARLLAAVKADGEAALKTKVQVWESVKRAALAGIPRDALKAECSTCWAALAPSVSVAYRAHEAGKLDAASAYSATAAALKAPRPEASQKTVDAAQSPAVAVRFEDGILAALMAARPVADGAVTWEVIRTALKVHDAEEAKRAAEARRGKGKRAADAAKRAPSQAAAPEAATAA